MKNIRHTSVTVEQYLRDQIAKSRAQTPVTFWGTDPTNHHGISYDPYMEMYMTYGTYMRQSKNDRHSNDNSSDKTNVNVDTQQENVEVKN